MKVLSATALTLFAAAPLAAQQPVRDTLVARAVASYTTRYVDPTCKLSKGHFKVSSGATYLQTSITASIVENQDRALENGRKVLIDAIEQNGQGQNAAAWYYLGRIYVRQGDIAGADSSFKRAQMLAPDCASDIGLYRQVAFAPIINRAIDFSKNNQPDSASVYFRRAAAWNPNSAMAPFALAGMFVTQKMDDSALVYYERALAAATDSSHATASIRNQASFNRALLLARTKRYPEAVAGFTQYLTLVPDDADAKKGLIQSLRGAGMADSAAAMEKRFGMASEAAAPVAGASADYNAAVAAFNEKRYAEAAAAANKFLASEPSNRDGLYIRARSYYELKQGPQLISATDALLKVDPMSETALVLLGNGYNLTKNSDMAVKTRLRLNAMPFKVASIAAVPGTSGVGVTGIAIGRAAMDGRMKPMAPAAGTLVFEMLNSTGTVIATQEVAVPALKPDEQFAIKFDAAGEGITAWRYHLK